MRITLYKAKNGKTKGEQKKKIKEQRVKTLKKRGMLK